MKERIKLLAEYQNKVLEGEIKELKKELGELKIHRQENND
jgi:hypothetical protein